MGKNKIPCGGFYVGDGLNVDENGVLNTGSGVGNVIVKIRDTGDDTYVTDKSFDDIKTAIDDGKYVSLYYSAEDEVFQLSDFASDTIVFTRTTPFDISRFLITDSNEVFYRYIDLEGNKNWLCSYNDDGFMTPVESLEYIKLKSPNGTLYTISVTNDGTIQAQVKP